jgi:magnesium transporter
MKTFKTKVSKKAGLPPGTLIHIGEKKTEKVKISVFEYNEEQYLEQDLETLTGFLPQKDKTFITWLNIEGIHQVDIVEQIGHLFKLHSLILEDIVNTEQFPKIEDYGDYLFIVLKMLSFNEDKNRIETEQVSLCIGSNFVLSFQEARGKDLFNPLRDRIKNGKGRIRKMGADYLLYSLMDAIVDSYFIVIEKLDEKIGILEDRVITKASQQTVMEIHKLKREMIFLRKSVWPLREIISSIDRGESPLITESVHVYLRDVMIIQ